MKLLDLFCGAGGAAMGYYKAGFKDITGVDNRPQPRYPFNFILADALEYLEDHGHEYEVIHASPPCQKWSKAAKQWRQEGKEYPDLIDPVRSLLIQTGKIYVIENVPGSPLKDPVILNGAMFGLKVHKTRWFECTIPIQYHLLKTSSSPVKMGRPVKEGDIMQVVGHFSSVEYARKVMQIDWSMTQKELAQAIPPAYTEWIGRRILEAIND